MSECIRPFDPCKWCGSRKHRPVACRIRAKHRMLLDGATPEEAGFVVIDATKRGGLIAAIKRLQMRRSRDE